MSQTIAFVGAAGGVGTTSLTLESGRLLAKEGHDTAILDVAYGTQGLSDRISGAIGPDMTALCLDDRPLEDGLIDLPLDGAGRLAACPAHAPFERLARAKTPEAAKRFEALLDQAARHFEYVLVDVPPVATNPAVAAATSAETVIVVADGDRADTIVPRTEDRLADICVSPSLTAVTQASAHPDADVALPAVGRDGPVATAESKASDPLVELVTTMTDISIERPDSSGLLEDVSFR